MKIEIKKQGRKSIALSLSPEELTIILPDSTLKQEADLRKVLNLVSRASSTHSHEFMTKEEFRNLIDGWVKKLEVKPNKIRIRKMKSKWASCSSKGNITFNSLLLHMPRDFAEYVSCSEICFQLTYPTGKML